MSIKAGKYYICDRCGTTSFFEKIGEEELDGGFTKFDKFKEATDWNTIYPKATHDTGSSKLLCPSCCKKYNSLMREFFDDPTDFDRQWELQHQPMHK